MNKNWNSYRIKDIAKVSRGGSPRPIQNYLTDDEVNGIPWIKISDATKVKKYIESTEQYILQSGVGKSNMVLPGDLIVSNSATPGIPRFLKIKACIHDGWLLLRKLKNVKKEFLFYLIESIRSKLKNQGTGSIFINLSIDILANEIVFIPPINEQEKIANFLDLETSKIDRKISILEQKFDKLEDYKQSVIFETVTKGIDNSVAMKDSEIDWIGDIPAHWEVKRVKDLFLLKKGKNAGTYAAEYIHDEENKGEYPVYSGQTENEGVMGSIKTFEYTYLNGVLFTTTVGAKAMSVKRLFNKFSLSQNCGLLVPTKEINLSYSYYLISSCFSFARQSIPSHMQPSLRKEDLNIFYCLDIPLNEQESIGVYLDSFTSKVDKKKEIIKKQIELLKEYKQTIIYEAVTGKMEIL